MPGPVVLIIGSLHYDIMVQVPALPRLDETLAGFGWQPKFGGKGGNQAIAAARAGKARICAALGADAFGAFLREGLAKGGVDSRFLQLVPGAGSGMSVALLLPDGSYAASIVSGANLALDPANLENSDLWRGVALLLLQNELPAPVNLAAARAARALGLPVLLNAAPARVLGPDVLACLTHLVVNAVEAEQMGCAPVTDLDSAQAAAAALAPNLPGVIVTAGAAGLAARDRGRLFTLPAERVQVVSTHGAGDAFCGTLAAALARGLPLEPACLLARRAASDHVAGGGC